MSINHTHNRHIIGGTLSKCPKCGGRYNAHPAISRVDNKTKICPMCGVKEALEAATGVEDGRVNKR